MGLIILIAISLASPAQAGFFSDAIDFLFCSTSEEETKIATLGAGDNPTTIYGEGWKEVCYPDGCCTRTEGIKTFKTWNGSYIPTEQLTTLAKITQIGTNTFEIEGIFGGLRVKWDGSLYYGEIYAPDTQEIKSYGVWTRVESFKTQGRKWQEETVTSVTFEKVSDTKLIAYCVLDSGGKLNHTYEFRNNFLDVKESYEVISGYNRKYRVVKRIDSIPSQGSLNNSSKRFNTAFFENELLWTWRDILPYTINRTYNETSEEWEGDGEYLYGYNTSQYVDKNNHWFYQLIGIDKIRDIGEKFVIDPTWVVGSGGNSWGGNVTHDDTVEVPCTGKLELQDAVPDYVSKWRFDKGAGNTAYDENETSNNDGTLNNMDANDWVSGYYGDYALDFDGTNDYVDCGADASLNVTDGEHTIMAWINSSTIPDATEYNHRVLNKGDSTYWWAINIIRTIGPAAKFEIAWDDDDVKKIATADNTLVLNTWYQIVGRREGTEYSLFINGIKQTDTETVGNDFTTPNNLLIGRKYDNTEEFDGIIDEIRIFNRGLSNDEINQTRDNGHKAEGNLTSWHDAGSGNETYKLSVNFTFPTNTNASINLYNNDTGAFIETLATHTTTADWNATIISAVQDSKANITLYGNITETPGIINITYHTQTAGVANPTLTTGNINNIEEDWGRDWNSNFSANVTGANASEVWMNFTNAEFTNTSLGNLNLSLPEWVNESHEVAAPVTNVSVTVTLNSTTSGANNDSDTFYYEITKRTNTATMDSASTQSVNVNENFYINATCNEEYGDTFYGSADLLEDGAIVDTEASITNYVNFSRNESVASVYNYTVKFYNTSHYFNATTSTFSNVTVSVVPVITLLEQTPSVIYQNSTGSLNISYGISHGSVGLNNTSVSFIYRNYDHDLSDSNHSIRPPSNNKSAIWNYNGRILRGANRNETLNFENNVTITGGDIYTWSGLDENNTRLTIVPVNSTYTKVYINGTIHDLMPQMWYLDRSDLQEAPKTQLGIHKHQNVLIKFWNFEVFKGNYNFLGVGYTDTDLHANPSFHPSDANPLEFYYVNSSYDPATGGDPVASGYAVYMGSLNATGWIDHVYEPHANSSYVRGFINNSLLHSYITTTEISYLYFTSDTPSSKPYYINVTNVANPTNVSFADTNVLWAGDTAPYTPQSYTPNVWFSFMKNNMSFDHKIYAADNNGHWANSTLNSTPIGKAFFPPTKPTISHFHYPPGSEDYDMNGTYSGTFDVGVGVATDPDGGTVTHNLTLHYANETIVAIINNTFTDADAGHGDPHADISFNSTPYYSDIETYTMKVVATDDEGKTSQSWLCVNFSLVATYNISGYVKDIDNLPISNAYVHDNQSVDFNYTNTSGYYFLTGFANGTYMITASADGFEDNSTNVTIAGADATNQNITLVDLETFLYEQYLLLIEENEMMGLSLLLGILIIVGVIFFLLGILVPHSVLTLLGSMTFFVTMVLPIPVLSNYPYFGIALASILLLFGLIGVIITFWQFFTTYNSDKGYHKWDDYFNNQ